MEMSQLIKYDLNLEKAYIYVKYILDNANTLSNELLKNIELTKGNFFTLLPPEADQTRIYEFKCGGILPQYPDIPYDENDPNSGTYSAIPTIDLDLIPLIEKKVKKNPDIVCIFDDVLSIASETKDYDFFQNHGFYYNKEVYYLLNKGSVSKTNLQIAIKNSNAFWHSLCILSYFKPTNQNLSVSDIKHLSEQAQLFFVIGYDRESFIFWEREPGMFWQNLQSK